MKKNTASQVIGAQMINASTGAAFTGSVTVYVTGDGGAQAVGSVGSGACTHEGNGYHTYNPAQAETNYDLCAFTFIGTGAIPVTVQVYTTFPQTGDNYARLGAPAGASVSADIAAVKSDSAAILIDTAEIGAAGAGLTAVPWNASWDAEVQSEVADGLAAFWTSPATLVDLIWDETLTSHVTADSAAVYVKDILTDTAEIGAAGAGLTEAGGTGDHLTAIPWNASWDAEVQSEVADGLTAFWTSPATLVDLVWDEVITGASHNVNGSAARFVREGAEAAGVTGTAQAGAAGTITLAAAASASDDIYNGERIQIIEGTGAGQARLITDYDGTTKVATVDRNWVVNPSTDSLYSIVGADADIRAIEGSDAAADNLLLFFNGTGYAGGTTKLDVNIASSDDIDLTATQKASVNAEVDTALATTTYAEPASVPAATASLKDKIGWLAALARNKLTSTATTQTLRNDADSASIGTSTHSDDGTTFTRGEWS